MRKLPITTLAVVLSLGMVAGASQIAAAKGKPGDVPTTTDPGRGHKPTVVSASGSPTCQIHGIFSLSASGGVSISGNITPVRGEAACANLGGVKVRTGHFTIHLTSTPVVTTIATTPTTASPSTTSTTLAPPPSSTSTTVVSCTLPAGPLANLGGGTVTWTPPSRVAPSTGITLTGGSLAVTDHVKVTYNAGSVTAGSFSNASAALSITSVATTATLQHSCSVSGALRFAFKGTITL